MSKIQQIERALLAINGAKFERFCNSYLSWKGYDFVISPGTVIGKEKSRKGIPDAYIPINTNEYIFIECTTKDRLGEAKSFFQKLSKDIDKCFDENKSKIKNRQIKKVILCFTQKLKTHEHNKLRQKCAAHGAELEVHGIDQLTNAVLRYPSLGKNFLDIPIDTQQLLSPTNFIKEYEKGKLSTPLSNKIYFRDKEINQALLILKECNLLIIEGNPGVGKSRLGLEVITQFCKSNSTYTPICIDNKGCPIYEDVRTCLQGEEDYILFIDDANRATKHYEFLITLLKEERKGNIKILATVRDYTINVIEDASKNFAHDRIKISPLSDKQIKKILESDDFKITNSIFIDTIARIAQGNPRLAIMAAEVALEKKDLSTFNDIPKIYENYYDKVIKETNKLSKIPFLKVIGIISFFKTIGKDYIHKDKIFSTFHISENEFWEKVIILHQTELINLFENEIVKIPDQILATYLFYKIFIRDSILDIYSLIINFYEDQQEKFRDALYSTINMFGFEHVKEKINKPVNQAWERFKNNNSRLLKLSSLFWIFNQEETLTHIHHKIDKIPEEAIKNDSFKIDENNFYRNNTDIKDWFGILKQFLEYPQLYKNYSFAIDLIFLYLKKQPSYMSEFIHFAKTELSFKNTDRIYNFYRQQVFLDKLYANMNNEGASKLFRAIFYHTANIFLQTTFQTSDMSNRDNTITIYTSEIPTTDHITHIRKKIWELLFKEFSHHKQNVLEVILQYIIDSYRQNAQKQNNKILFWKEEAKLLLPFIEKNFDTTRYQECKIAQAYFKELEMLNIPFNADLKKIFTNDKYELSLKLNQDIIDGKNKRDIYNNLKLKKENKKTNSKAINDLKYKELEKYTDGYKVKDYKKLWRDINELWKEEKDRNKWSIEMSSFQILRILAIKDIDTFLETLEYIFNNAEIIEFFSTTYINNITANALNSLNDNHYRLLYIINKSSKKNIIHWKLAFFRQLNSKYVNSYYMKQLLKSIKQIKEHYSFFNFDFLDKYTFKPNIYEVIKGWFSQKNKNANKNIYTKVASILIKKTKTEKLIFFFGHDFISKHATKFSSNLDLLSLIYFSNFKSESNFDHLGKEMKHLCYLKPDFLIDFLKENYSSENSIADRRLPSHNFKFVWDFDNYTKMIDDLILFIKEDKSISLGWDYFAKKLFKTNSQEQIDKKTNYIKSFIKRYFKSKKAMQLIFSAIACSFPNRRIECLKQFLNLNQDPDVFESLIPHVYLIAIGSRIATIEMNVKFVNQLEKMLESMPNSNDFIHHRVIIKKEINYLEKEIIRERKREFVNYFR